MTHKKIRGIIETIRDPSLRDPSLGDPSLGCIVKLDNDKVDRIIVTALTEGLSEQFQVGASVEFTGTLDNATSIFTADKMSFDSV